MNDLTVRCGMQAQGGEVVRDRIGSPVGERGQQRGGTDIMRCDRKAGKAAGASVGSNVGERGMNVAMLSQKGLGMCRFGHCKKQPISRNVLFMCKNKESLVERGGNFETGSEGLQRFPKNEEHRL